MNSRNPMNSMNRGFPNNIHAVILAGGSGTRFWPLSRETCPKQMLQGLRESFFIGRCLLMGDTMELFSLVPRLFVLLPLILLTTPSSDLS